MIASRSGEGLELPTIADPFASRVRPVLVGSAGAVSAAHPLAVSAGLEVLSAGGSSVDSTIAAQAVLCVIAPDACGIGGDMFCLVRTPDGKTTAINAAGAAPAALGHATTDGGDSVTVPGLVAGWDLMAERWGRLPLARVLAPAVRLARSGMVVSPRLARAFEEQRSRLLRGGAGHWPLMTAAPGQIVPQLTLATVLDRISKERSGAFYQGLIAEGIAASIAAAGGSLSVDDMLAHRTVILEPIRIRWRDLTVLVQPPMSQGILLAMAMQAVERVGQVAEDCLDHIAIEATEAAFAFRARVGEGAALLREALPIDPKTAGRRGGPRPYLHTAGVASADSSGMTTASLVSVFDDFGSGVYVPQGGFVLNNPRRRLHGSAERGCVGEAAGTYASTRDD